MKRILCYGDSNTWGHNPDDGSRLNYRWTSGLISAFPECEITIDGVCGRSTHFDVPDTPCSHGIDCFRERYIQSDSRFDLIIIMLGTNDTLNYFDCDARETADAIGGFVREYRKKYGDGTKFLIVSPILIRDCALNHPVFKTLYSEGSVRASKDFAAAISEAAKRENAYFLDAAEYAAASDTDGIHMSEAEHKKLAQGIIKKVKEIL